MKFIVVENHTQSVSKKEFKTFIHTHCNQFLKEKHSQQALFRGIRSREPYLIIIPRTNRKPLSTPRVIHDWMDFLFFENFGWKARSEGIFATGSHKEAGYYGNVYAIYPVDGYKYLWSPKVKDLYTHLDWDADKDLNMEDEEIEGLLETYKSTDLTQAIDSGNEIMIKCSQYAAELVRSIE